MATRLEKKSPTLGVEVGGSHPAFFVEILHDSGRAGTPFSVHYSMGDFAATDRFSDLRDAVAAADQRMEQVRGALSRRSLAA